MWGSPLDCNNWLQHHGRFVMRGMESKDSNVCVNDEPSAPPSLPIFVPFPSRLDEALQLEPQSTIGGCSQSSEAMMTWWGGGKCVRVCKANKIAFKSVIR